MQLAENSAEAVPARVVDRPFAKGVSGNPGGRPKGLARYVRELVGDDWRRVADFMLAVLEDETERIEVRMEAARWLADRGFGRAHVPVEVSGPAEPVTIVFDSPILRRIEEATEQRNIDASRPALPPVPDVGI